MRFRDTVLVVPTSVIWGLAVVETKLGLDGFSAAEPTALRFPIASVPVFLTPRPRIAWRRLIEIGLTLFTRAFLPLFLAFKAGMPAVLLTATSCRSGGLDQENGKPARRQHPQRPRYVAD